MADSSLLSLSYPETDIALITLDDPGKGANILSSGALDGLEGILGELETKGDLAGLIIASAKPGMFIAGADLKEFMRWIDAPADEVIGFCRRGQTLFGRLAALPAVSVAAIDGLCLGGGAELAMWCDRRVFTSEAKTQYGFPEVKLGLFPGWGGTARLPRMIGLANAVEMVTGGESIDAEAAYKLALAADVVPRERLQKAAVHMVRSEQKSKAYLEDRRRWAAEIEISPMELGFLAATASAYIQQQTGGHYPAPEAALELMLGATEVDLETACGREAEAFAEQFGSPVNRALLNVFFLQDANKKDPGVADRSIEPRKIESVSVIGAGVMGQGIAAAHVKRKIPTSVTDANEEALARGLSAILEEVSYNKRIKSSDVERAVEFAPLLGGTVSAGELASADLVIEAVVENAEVKKKLFGEFEGRLRDDAILASNTSTIPITELAADLAHPERFCGMHFFNPVRKMPLVEVIRGDRTSDATVAAVVAHAKALGKSPIVVQDGPGFLVNRVLLPYMNEAVQLLTEGAEMKAVDKAARKFGMPMGPLALFDVVGIDVAVHAGRVMQEAFPDRTVHSGLLDAMLEEGRLGQKSGRGFFQYGGKKGKAEPDPDVDAFIARFRREEKEFSPPELTDRLFLPVLLEATRILEDGLVRKPQDIDLALIYGIGFPPFRGGLLFWADSLGAEALLERLELLTPLGKRYEPTETLQKMAAGGRKFYD